MSQNREMASPTAEALSEQVRRGDDLARLAWADLYEEQGDLEAAAALRALPELAKEMQFERPPSAGSRPDLILSLRGEWAWEDAAPTRPRRSTALRTLLSRGDELIAAIGWLAERLGLGAVNDQAGAAS
jgi:hypothetical protein